MTPIYVPSLPDLEPTPCPSCQGQGGFDGDHTEPGKVYQAWGGAGETDVCPNCRMEPYLVEGIEACGCTVVVFALTEKAAA